MAQSKPSSGAPERSEAAGSIASFVQAAMTSLQLSPRDIWAMSPREIHFFVAQKCRDQPQRPGRRDLDYLFSLDEAPTRKEDAK